MKVLGIDPSLTNFGWAMHDTKAPVGTPDRCLSRGRFQTPASMEFVVRYMTQRDRLAALVREHKPDKVGIEFPIMDAMFSEGMYGLFLYSCEALRSEGCDVVFWSPLQVKAHARETLGRPKSWVMDKMDMVEAAKHDAGGKTWNHNEADAYLVARLAGRFWNLHAGTITEDTLTPTERKYFTEIKQFVRGRKAGQEERRGVIYREDDRFFMWSTNLSPKE
jgi:Holliday junction resolvasome RuvABC endonuclease subunit